MSERSPDAVLGGRKCPLCGKPAVQRFRPFCSGRCADIDLGRWLKGTYAIPTEESVSQSESSSGGDSEDAG